MSKIKIDLEAQALYLYTCDVCLGEAVGTEFAPAGWSTGYGFGGDYYLCPSCAED